MQAMARRSVLRRAWQRAQQAIRHASRAREASRYNSRPRLALDEKRRILRRYLPENVVEEVRGAEARIAAAVAEARAAWEAEAAAAEAQAAQEAEVRMAAAVAEAEMAKQELTAQRDAAKEEVKTSVAMISKLTAII